MQLKEFGLEYFSQEKGIKIHTLNKSDFEKYMDWFRKWEVSEEFIDKLSDTEVIDLMCSFVQKSFFMFSMKFIMTKDDNLIGSFSIWKDDKIRLKTSDFSKNIYNLAIHFVDNISSNDITFYIRQYIEALLYFKLKINSLYLFKIYNEKYIKNLFENGFLEIGQDLFYSKLEKFLENNKIKNDYKESAILIKNI